MCWLDDRRTLVSDDIELLDQREVEKRRAKTTRSLSSILALFCEFVCRVVTLDGTVAEQAVGHLGEFTRLSEGENNFTIQRYGSFPPKNVLTLVFWNTHGIISVGRNSSRLHTARLFTRNQTRWATRDRGY